jgi:uncharacterized membrane protein
MNIFFIAFLGVFLPMLVIDAVWLTVMSKFFYNKYLAHLLSESPHLLPAGIFYVIYSLGVAFLIVLPALEGGFSNSKTFFYGAIFGFVAYATYDLTNHATLKDWPLTVTVVDMVWGALLTGTLSLIALLVTKHFV